MPNLYLLCSESVQYSAAQETIFLGHIFYTILPFLLAMFLVLIGVAVLHAL